MFAPIAAVVSILIYLSLVAGLCYINIRSLKGRAGRMPVGDDKRLLRQAGESLRRRIAAADEALLNNLATLLAVPPLAAGLPLWLCSFFPQTHAFGWLTACLALFLLSLVLCLRRLMKTTHELRNCRLGLAGERLVADYLHKLAAKGYAIFHDVPCQGASGIFYLDHVVVGGGGVAVIETKTRRKKAAEDGSKDYVVNYDGTALVWPGGFRDGDSVEQAVGNARWLREKLRRELNIVTEPLPVLTIPGWWVEAKARKPVAAMNPSHLADALPLRMTKNLTDKDMDQIARHLRSRCEDVDFNDPV